MILSLQMLLVLGLMGFEPNRIPDIREAARFLGNPTMDTIDQVGEILDPPDVPFEVVGDWAYLHQKISTQTSPKRTPVTFAPGFGIYDVKHEE